MGTTFCTEWGARWYWQYRGPIKEYLSVLFQCPFAKVHQLKCNTCTHKNHTVKILLSIGPTST